MPNDVLVVSIFNELNRKKKAAMFAAKFRMTVTPGGRK